MIIIMIMRENEVGSIIRKIFYFFKFIIIEREKESKMNLICTIHRDLNSFLLYFISCITKMVKLNNRKKEDA